MRTAIRIVAALLVVSLGWLVVDWLFPGDERKIRAALDELSTTFSEPSEPGLASVARAARLAKFFAPDVVVDLGRPYSPIVGRDTLLAMAANTQVPGEGLDVRFVDVTVDVAPGGQEALVHLTATVSEQGRPLDQNLDAKELEMAWRVVDGDWVIARVTGVETLERPR